MPDLGRSRAAQYAAALEQIAWADRHGRPIVFIPEHHGTSDGYLPSPLTMSAAAAACTSRATILPCLVPTLRDPFAVAEDLAVLDLISDGRTEVLLVAGYLRREFAMFGVEFDKRGSIFEDKIAVIRRLLTGDTVTYQGRTGQITPLPVQRPPKMILGGSSLASARRAAVLGDGYWPAVSTPRLQQIYLTLCDQAGRRAGLIQPPTIQAIFVAEDPEREWTRIGPSVLHDMNEYRKYSASTPGASLYAHQTLDTIADVRKTGMYLVVTPAECVELAMSLLPGQGLPLHPLIGGLDPDIGWSSLELFVNRVLPELGE